METYDLLIQGGHVIDPAQSIDKVIDVVVHKGLIAAIAPTSDTHYAHKTLDASGCYVVPGLIDLHTHVYWGATPLGVNPDDIYQRSGITTFVDAGSSGAGNFVGLSEFIIKPSVFNVYSFLNISFPGIFGFHKNINVGEGSVLDLLSVEEAVSICRQYPEWIVGIKVRACRQSARENGRIALQLAIEAADQTQLPIMAHIGFPPPTNSEIIELLRPGDIITHVFRDAPNTLVSQDNVIKDCFFQARDKGLILDIGHGKGGFSFRVAQCFADKGIWPDTISSDVHVMSVNGPAYDLLTTMSKFLCLGMPLNEIIAAVTFNSACAIRKNEIGSLKS